MGLRTKQETSTGAYNAQLIYLETTEKILYAANLYDKLSSIPANDGYAEIGLLESGVTNQFVSVVLARGIFDRQTAVSWTGQLPLGNTSVVYARIWIPADVVVKLTALAFPWVVAEGIIKGIDP